MVFSSGGTSRIVLPALGRLDLQLGGLSGNQVLLHQARCGRILIVLGVVFWRICWLVWNARFQVENQTECRVAVEVITMQPLGSQEAQIFVDSQRWNVVDLSLQGDLWPQVSLHVEASGGERTSSASFSIILSTASLTSFEAIPWPRYCSRVASIAI